MDKNVTVLFREIHEKDIRDLVKDHVQSINVDEEKKEITALIDKRYAMNLLQSSQYAKEFVGWLKKCFWEHNSIVLKLSNPHHSHDREMLVPYIVHYG